MAEQQLLDYIRESHAKGFSSESIKSDLLAAGWSQEQINDAADHLLTVPKPPAPPAIPVPKPPEPAHPVVIRTSYTSPFSSFLAAALVLALLILTQNAVADILDSVAPTNSNFQSSQAAQDFKKSYEAQRPKQEQFASYGEFINAQDKWATERSTKATEAEQRYITSLHLATPSFRMIVHSIVVLPLWIITFLLYAFLKDDRKRFEALMAPYFITSAWMLIYLFFSVAKYIYSSNSTLGVYVAFGMLAVVLTGAIWGIQKYRHQT